MSARTFITFVIALMICSSYGVVGDCDVNATSCGDCVSASTDCAFCKTISDDAPFGATKCQKSEGTIDPCGGRCGKDDCLSRTCAVKFKLLIIILPSVAAGVLLILGIWIYCCCCRKSKARRLKTLKFKESKAERRERQRREERSAVRKSEREERTAAIRAKYGIQSAVEDNDEDDLIDDDDY
eukprot:m.86972 g.86972  ORF g.86972 m.86972 type:complete len:183 (-) comp13080_c1_seq1:3347-3895(-)